ncbi:MAG: hypothetical protein CME64_10620 [Halobacteriovoraceae bacterium]|nr:hypothetical protein [Halobacteriovoraceae bacterium]|tara:strand:- start:53520 stop:54347 length:828 start_codon:yes stop_codon:yes gene_type:complete
MKKKTLLIALSLFALTSCLSPEATSTSNTTVNSGGDSDGGSSSGGGSGSGSDGGGSTGGGIGGGTGVTCYGSQADGQGDGFPIRQKEFMLAGHTSWKPWNNSDNYNQLGKDSIWAIDVASNALQSDSRFKFRVKLHEQPEPGGSPQTEYCFGRSYPAADDQHLYTKIKFKVSLRDVQCPGGQLDKSCTLGPRYSTETVGPVSVDQCSPIIDFSTKRNFSTYGTVVEIWDVRSDNACQATESSHDCGSDGTRTQLRRQSCWAATMQISTDYTQDFK